MTMKLDVDQALFDMKNMMRGGEPHEKYCSGLIVFCVFLGWAVVLLFSLMSGRVMYGDGAFFLHTLLLKSKFELYDPQRSFASLITQAPVLLGIRVHFNGIAIYALLYQIGNFIFPALLMCGGLYIVKTQRIALAVFMVAIIIYGFGINFINTEANILFGLVWLSVAIMVSDKAPRVLHGVLLPVLAFSLLRAYEGMFMVGPVLAIWAFVAANRSEDPYKRIGLMLSGYLFLLGSVMGFGGVLAPRDPSNAANFINDVFSFLWLPHVFLLLSSIASITYIFVSNRLVRVVSVFCIFAFGSIYLWQMLNINGYYGFAELFRNRAFMIVALPVVVGFLFLIYWIRPKLLLEKTNGAAMILLVPFAYALIADMQVTRQWSAYTEKFCEVLHANISPQDSIDALISDEAMVMGWTWTHPTLSILLRDQGSPAYVANQQGATQWEPYSGVAPALPYKGFCQSRF